MIKRNNSLRKHNNHKKASTHNRASKCMKQVLKIKIDRTTIAYGDLNSPQ